MKKKLLIALCLPLVTILIIGAAQMIPGSVGYPPTGSNGQIQYYTNGVLGASSMLNCDGTGLYLNNGLRLSFSGNTYIQAAGTAPLTFNVQSSGTVLSMDSGGSTFNIGIKNNGYLSCPTITKSTNYTLTVSDHTVLAAADNLTLTFPSTTNIAGRIYRVKLVTPAVSLTLTNSNGIELFDGALSHSMTTSNTCAAFQTDGTNWWKISN